VSLLTIPAAVLEARFGVQEIEKADRRLQIVISYSNDSNAWKITRLSAEGSHYLISGASESGTKMSPILADQ
jgi:hypothetical protein